MRSVMSQQKYKKCVQDESTFTPQSRLDARNLSEHNKSAAPSFFHPRITMKDIALARARARENGTTIEEELIADHVIDEDAHFRHIADILGLNYIDQIDPARIIMNGYSDIGLRQKTPIQYELGGRIMVILAPNITDAELLKLRLSRFPHLKNRLAISSPKLINQALWVQNRDLRAQKIVHDLPDNHPDMSAKTVLSASQGFVMGALFSSSVALVYVSNYSPITLIHVCFSLLFLSFNLLKLGAALTARKRPWQTNLTPSSSPLPVYTVLVALYNEASVAKQLVWAMSRLNWPKSKLDIKLICEEDDLETINALEMARPGSQFEIIKVPRHGPRTKPKALQYALEGARGEFVTVYDAEDIPNPNQLREAYQHFSHAPESLACLQAPLVISNARQTWLSALFALEYAGLFRQLIPMLARFGLPIPLGGTSNHFRKSALFNVGGWDPYNVTEDADLGIRLNRYGYQTGIIQLPTLEHAPEELNIWTRQRTRWLKGWMQTWFVVMRNPLTTARNLGGLHFIILQILIGGMIIAAITHPLCYFFVVLNLTKGWFFGLDTISNATFGLMVIDSFNLLAGYIIFGWLGWRAFIETEKAQFRLSWLINIPIYWLVMSMASWRAVSQLLFGQPHMWEKTPHRAIAPIELGQAK